MALYPLASHQQIERTPSREDGIPVELEEDLRAYGCKLIQQAGILLKQKQVAMATAQILFQRFFYVSSLKQFGIGDVGMGAFYLASKLEECPVRMRDLINVYELLLQRSNHQQTATKNPTELIPEFKYTPMSYFAQAFYDMKDALVVAEMQILKRLGFNVHVVLPYGTLVNYLRVLGLINREDVSQKAWGYLNDALQTPVYALYSIPTIVCAAILITARHLRIPLPSQPDNCWWELFDAGWEDVWSVAGHIMRLYRPRSVEELAIPMGLLTKKSVRVWLETNSSAIENHL